MPPSPAGGRSDTRFCLERRKHLSNQAENQEKAPRNHWSKTERAADKATNLEIASLEWERHRQFLAYEADQGGSGPVDKGSARRALALSMCGELSTAVDPSSGELLRGLHDGKPSVGQRSCQSRWCRRCGRNRATRLADELTVVVDALLKRPDISDGRLHMVTLTAPDPRNGKLSTQTTALWAAWSETRKAHPEAFKHCFAALELTYNSERNSYHPHLHVMVIAKDRPDKWGILSTWQRALGIDVNSTMPHRADAVVDGQRIYHDACKCRHCERSRGGVDVQEKQSIKEGIKYPLKGLGETLSTMPQDRALEVMRYFQGKRTFRCYGALFGKVRETDDVDTVDEVMDALLVNPETGELFATTSTLAAHAGCRQSRWSWSLRMTELARECLYAMHDAPEDDDDVEMRKRKGRRRLRKQLARKWRAKQRRIRSTTSAQRRLTGGLVVADLARDV